MDPKKSAFEKRETAFEAEYFNRQEAETIEKLKAVFRKKVDKAEIMKSTGIASDEVLDALVELNINGELMAAFHLYPLVEIAWADGSLDDKEVTAVMDAAAGRGVLPGTASHAYLEERLRRGPSPDHDKIWQMLAAELKSSLSPAELAAFRNDLIALCRDVAAASGGVFGVAFAVSGAEKAILDKITRALTP